LKIKTTNKNLLKIKSQIMKILKTIIVFVLLTFSFSCSKEETQPEIPKITTVYVAGVHNGKAVVWKDARMTLLPSSNDYARANSVYVVNDDMYVAGTDGGYKNENAVFWKNGVKTTLGTKRSFANAIAVVHNTIYVVGQENYKATLWVNGIATILPTTNSSDALAIFIKENKVYIVGNSDNKPCLWNNGTVSYLSDNIGNARAVYVLGKTIYAAGSDFTNSISQGRLWKNGVSTILAGDNSSFNAMTIGVKTYLAGSVYNSIKNENNAVIWEDGVPKPVSIMNSNFYSIFTFADDIYISGQVTTDIRRAFLTKNGKQIPLLPEDNYESSAYSIFVTEK